jgi:hypothetical protein
VIAHFDTVCLSTGLAIHQARLFISPAWIFIYPACVSCSLALLLIALVDRAGASFAEESLFVSSFRFVAHCKQQLISDLFLTQTKRGVAGRQTAVYGLSTVVL